MTERKRSVQRWENGAENVVGGIISLRCANRKTRGGCIKSTVNERARTLNQTQPWMTEIHIF